MRQARVAPRLPAGGADGARPEARRGGGGRRAAMRARTRASKQAPPRRAGRRRTGRWRARRAGIRAQRRVCGRRGGRGGGGGSWGRAGRGRRGRGRRGRRGASPAAAAAAARALQGHHAHGHRGVPGAPADALLVQGPGARAPVFRAARSSGRLPAISRPTRAFGERGRLLGSQRSSCRKVGTQGVTGDMHTERSARRRSRVHLERRSGERAERAAAARAGVAQRAPARTAGVLRRPGARAVGGVARRAGRARRGAPVPAPGARAGRRHGRRAPQHPHCACHARAVWSTRQA